MNAKSAMLRRQDRLDRVSKAERVIKQGRPKKHDFPLADVIESSPESITPDKLPDPWLFDSEKLLDRLAFIRRLTSDSSLSIQHRQDKCRSRLLLAFRAGFAVSASAPSRRPME